MDEKRLLRHWQDEGDAGFLYRVLAELEKERQKREIYLKLAGVEDRHKEEFGKALEVAGKRMGSFQPSLRARLLAWVARIFGPGILLNLRMREEGQDFRQYLKDSSRIDSEEERKAYTLKAVEEKKHSEMLQALMGMVSEPWHRMESGGFLRNVVYGFNDGLTANLGLVMGVVGASVPTHIVIISGLAGMVSDALSMGSSGFLAAKSEAEVYAHEIALEREEIALMPEIETEELALLYEARGLPGEMALEAARRVMQNPEQALKEKTTQELGISARTASPLKEGTTTGIATAFGAFIPILPFFFLPFEVALWTSFGISMLSHFLVGAARSVFTGRGVIRSGLDMFIVGLGVAFVGYIFGFLLEGAFR